MNQTNIQQLIFFKYFIDAIQKQKTDKSIEQSPTSNKLLKECSQDDVYLERRRKNNQAAKRSRDVRRAKEDEIALR
jgi:hypothetical protein